MTAVTTSDGRLLQAFADDPPTRVGMANGDPAPSRADAPTGGAVPAVVWHHGSPHTGALLPPLVDAARERGIRLVTYARPAYGGSTPLPGRDVASAAADVAAVADAFGLERFAVVGASGGAPHALACAALLPDRVTAAACFASPAPYTDSFDWFAGMASDGALRAARRGRSARAAEPGDFRPEVFVATDWAALEGTWTAIGADAGRAGEAGPDGLIDDDVAFTQPWGFALAAVRVPVLLVHGALDRMIPVSHADALARELPRAELWRLPEDGHVSVLSAYGAALDWLLTHAD